QDELRRNPEAREAYREYLLLEHSLRFRSKGVDLLRVVPMDQVNERRQRRLMKTAGLSAAAVLALAAVVMTLILSHTPPPTVAFETSPGTELLISHRLAGDTPPEGQVMEPGSRLQLQRGSVELQFASGVRGIVRGPADLTLRREDLLDLSTGTVWFEVPSQAVGFQVVTPDLVLTDLGTEFGIISKPDSLDEVHVFTGKVVVLNRHGLKKQEMLTAGQARNAGPAGRWNEIPASRDPFLTKLPTTGRALVTLDDSATFTTSPGNNMVKPPYLFAANSELAGFNASASDKLVVTLSHEHGAINNVTYGGVAMVPAIQAESSGNQKTAIYYLDSPGVGGDLVVTMNGKCNGVGGSLLALSNTAPGNPVAASSSKAKSAGLTTPVANCILIASHACNTDGRNQVAKAQPPLTAVFSGPTGSSVGGSGYRQVAKAGSVSAAFSGSKVKPVTAVAAFAPIP
ncbi:MAG TPA: FecR domain-containing protein, partial [Verrucomicrobiae bacterium]|nr:FecR domain-containing protein [Verrucomicrobiae bacterium]